jgi:hypothetical protein
LNDPYCLSVTLAHQYQYHLLSSTVIQTLWSSLSPNHVLSSKRRPDPLASQFSLESSVNPFYRSTLHPFNPSGLKLFHRSSIIDSLNLPTSSPLNNGGMDRVLIR